MEDLASFISKNKHLPGIPSAGEVKRDGLDLGEMQNKLLQKVEELTLYVLQLNEENQKLRKMIWDDNASNK